MHSEDAHPSSADRYERLELIGTGSFGEVYRGWDRENGLEVAVKVIDLESVEDDIADIHREVATLAQCKSSNITEYYASVMLPGTTELLIVMELMACSVNDLLSDEGSPLDERSIAFILRETLKALVYLHENHRIHRDVKSANILLSAHGEVKISDFGVSGQLSKTVAFKRKTFVGSPFWMAPEVIRANTGGDGYAETADIWSLGITAYEMAHGKPPHADLHPMRALFLIPAEDAPRLEGPYSMEFKSFISQCLQKDPALRPSAAALLRHPFLEGPHDSGRLAELVHMHAKRGDSMHASGGDLRTFKAQIGTVRWDPDQPEEVQLEPGIQTLQPSIRSHQLKGFTVREAHVGGTVLAPPTTSRIPEGDFAEVDSTAGAVTGGLSSTIAEDDALSQSELSERSGHARVASMDEDARWHTSHTISEIPPSMHSAFHTAADNEILAEMLAPALGSTGESTPRPAAATSTSSCRPIFSLETLESLDEQPEDGSFKIRGSNGKERFKSTDHGALAKFLLARWQSSVKSRLVAGAATASISPSRG